MLSLSVSLFLKLCKYYLPWRMIVDVLDDDVEESGCLLGGAAQVPRLEDQGVALPLLPVQRHAGGDQT